MAIAAVQTAISFYSDNENFDTCVINGSKFALFSKTLTAEASMSIDLSDYYIVLLDQLEASANISIKALSILGFSEIHAKRGEVKIHVSERLDFLGATIESHSGNDIKARRDIGLHTIVTENKKEIISKFKEGIQNHNGFTVLDALLDTYDIIVDPNLSEEANPLDIPNAFNYFGIPTQPPVIVT